MKRKLNLVILLGLMAAVISSCLGIDRVSVYCDSVFVRYFFDVNEGHAPGDYRLEVYHEGVLVGSSDVVAVGDDNPAGEVRVALNETFDEGTVLRVVAVYTNSDPDESEIITEAPCQIDEDSDEVELTWCDVAETDGRINNHCYAYAAVYCQDDAQRVAIYGIPPVDQNGHTAGQGFPAIFVNYIDLPPIPTADEGNQLISQHDNISFYRLTTGEYQVNAGPDAEGKSYVVIWDGCPWTTVSAYILQNGVMTQTEVYPHS